MNYRKIKELRDKLWREIEGLKLCEGKYENDKIIKAKKSKYNFYNNLLKAYN